MHSQFWNVFYLAGFLGGAKTLVLFATNTPGGVTATNRQKMKVWEFSAQKPNGEYDFHLIPSKRNSDGEAGMYDTVTKTFFTNAGTGNFIAGPEI